MRKISIISIIACCCFAFAMSTLYSQNPLIAVRAYGGSNELSPPVLLLKNNQRSIAPIGEATVTIEMDVLTENPPQLFVKFVHCNERWLESENVIINSLGIFQTSAVDWTQAPGQSKYFRWRGKVLLPSAQIQFPVSGNWLAKIYTLDNTEEVLSTVKIFVVEALIPSRTVMLNDFYKPTSRFAASSAYNYEVIVDGTPRLLDFQLNTVAMYRMNWWNNPMYISLNNEEGKDEYTDEELYGDGENIDDNSTKNNPHRQQLSSSITDQGPFPTNISGFANVRKMFRMNNVPSFNEYRIFDCSNPGLFPFVEEGVQLPFRDLRRRNQFLEYADDGYIVTSRVSQFADEYIRVEFVLDPEKLPVDKSVFVVGSFNNWTPTREWEMSYDSEREVYSLKQWIRRGRHSYLYGIGTLNFEKNRVEGLSFEEFEGNTIHSRQTMISFVYYRELQYGGYDAIISVSAVNSQGTFQR